MMSSSSRRTASIRRAGLRAGSDSSALLFFRFPRSVALGAAGRGRLKRKRKGKITADNTTQKGEPYTPDERAPTFALTSF